MPCLEAEPVAALKDEGISAIKPNHLPDALYQVLVLRSCCLGTTDSWNNPFFEAFAMLWSSDLILLSHANSPASSCCCCCCRLSLVRWQMLAYLAGARKQGKCCLKFCWSFRGNGLLRCYRADYSWLAQKKTEANKNPSMPWALLVALERWICQYSGWVYK